MTQINAQEATDIINRAITALEAVDWLVIKRADDDRSKEFLAVLKTMAEDIETWPERERIARDLIERHIKKGYLRRELTEDGSTVLYTTEKWKRERDEKLKLPTVRQVLEGKSRPSSEDE